MCSKRSKFCLPLQQEPFEGYSCSVGERSFEKQCVKGATRVGEGMKGREGKERKLHVRNILKGEGVCNEKENIIWNGRGGEGSTERKRTGLDRKDRT